jgi:predicted nucleotidyltransferase
MCSPLKARERVMTQTSTSPLQALNIAEEVFRSRNAGAMFAFAAGSIFRGEGTYHSDLDLVVVYDHLAAARTKSFVVDGLPVESFVHDSAMVEWFIEADIERGRPSLPT